ncbi:hypothetical protein D3C85_1568110 [compost metagenome]
MSSPCPAVTPDRAAAYLGQTVLVELILEEEPESLWRCFHIVGVVVPVEGLVKDGHFLVLNALRPERFPSEVYWDDIHTLAPIHQRATGGAELAPRTLGGLIRSGAALPARRNRISIPSNGSTGAAHP